MSLTVLSVAYPFARVGPQAVGGAEQILTWLDGELMRRGHRSLVLACVGSSTAGTLVPTEVPPGLITPEVRRAVVAAHQKGLDQALASGQVDLVHMHGIDFAEYRIADHVPVLVTLHLPPAWYPKAIWQLPDNYRLVCVSQAQRRACPAGATPCVVENGVPQDERERRGARRRFALMLSRICPEKNLHAGFDAGRLADVPVLLGGEAFLYEDHLRYLREEIEPRLGAGACWPGALVAMRKARFLRAAQCLLLPTLAPETSSLVAMEAMAAGTPVIAYPSGAIPEIVAHEQTGFLVENVEQMAEAIGRAREIDAGVCVATARERFSLDRMVNGYLQEYATMLQTL